MKPNYFNTLLLMVLAVTVNAQKPDLVWANVLNTTASLQTIVITSDQNGNVYVSGDFSGTVDFDPGPGVAQVQGDSSFSSANAFLAKYDANGLFLFVKTWEALIVDDLVIDQASGPVMAGTFYDTFDSDPGQGVSTFVNAGPSGGDVCVIRLDEQGNYLNAWAFGATDNQRAERLAIDTNGDIHVLGEFDDFIDFDLSSGNGTFIGEDDDLFLAKYSPSGNFLDGFVLNSHRPEDIVIDANDHIIISADFLDPFDANPGSGTTILTSVGGYDGAVMRFDANYTFIDAYSLDGGMDELALDAQNALFISGRLPDSMDVDFGAGVDMLYSENTFDIYYAKYDANMNYLHGNAYVSNATYIQNDMTTGRQGAMYMAGRFLDTVNFNPAGSNGELISQGSNDVFLMGVSADGTFGFAHGFGDFAGDEMEDIHTTENGAIYTTFRMLGSIDVDMNAGATTVSSTGTNQAIVFARYQDSISTTLLEQENEDSFSVIGGDDVLLLNLPSVAKPFFIQIHNLKGSLVAQKYLADGQHLISIPSRSAHAHFVSVYGAWGKRTKRVVVW